jgi:hypothetical protein
MELNVRESLVYKILEVFEGEWGGERGAAEGLSSLWNA